MLDGIVYKDKAEDARRYLGTKGDPYKAIGDDRTGRAAIDFGVYGVPETFVVKGDGTIAFKLIGPVTPDIYRDPRRRNRQGRTLGEACPQSADL